MRPLLALLPLLGGDADEAARPLALRAAKALVASWEGEQVIDQAVLVARDGRIQDVGPWAGTRVPPDCEVLDLGASWIMPGMIDLHTHIGGTGDINDMVYQTNEGLRVSSAVVPGNRALKMVLSAGVTTVLFIPGSGTNVGGQGILIKTGFPTFEEMRVRDPGSVKIAQGDNPTRWGYGMGRSLMNWHIRGTVRRGLAYAQRRAGTAAGGEAGEAPERNVQFDAFEDLAARRAQVSTHTQNYRLVLSTLSMLKGEFELDVYIDHGEWGAFRLAPIAERMGVNAIIGPRIIDTFAGPGNTDGRILSAPGEYQARGLRHVGFNTDAPVVPGEELPLQAACGVRYGMDNSAMQAVRGLTIVPARTAGIAGRVGSLERGKDADVVVLSGDPADPRSAVEKVFIEGRLVYEAGAEPRRW